ncbi:MAG: hypothetical protein C9356_00705 [Oleiphilus sp.]|nr:MAG: hypothetical protein C9356_00705 [Oleiphilus sp.]
MRFKMAFRRIFLCSILLALSTIQLSAQERYSALESWLSLESDNFRVTFLPQHQGIAEHALEKAESLLPQLRSYFQWQPEHRVEILISHTQDISNGYATPFPYNRIVLFTPKPGMHDELSDHGDWLEDLLRHELVHIIHLDKAEGAPRMLRSLFGRNLFLFPNLFQPTFYKEGLATYLETSLAKGTGRGQSAYYDMILRTEVYGGMLPLAKVQQQNPEWPVNQSYSYGVAFFQFLSEHAGPELAARLVDTMSKQIVPLRLDPPLAAHTPFVSIENAWVAFEEWLQQRYKEQIQDIFSATDTTRQQKLSHSGFFNGAPFADAQGNIFYSAFDPYQPQQLRQISPEGEPRNLHRLYGKTEIAGRTGNFLWYLQDSPCNHHRRSFDLYRLDLDSLDASRITHCSHYVQGLVTGENVESAHLLALKEINGRKHIVSVDIATLEERVLRAGELNENFASPHWLEPEKAIVYAYKPPHQPWQIARFNLGAKQHKVLVQDAEAGFYAVAVSPDRNYLYLESDKDGLVEIWRSELDGRQLQQITRSIGGATRPTIDLKGQRLIFRGYDQDGWNIYQAPLLPVSEADIALPQALKTDIEHPVHQADNKPALSLGKPAPYRALDTIWPTTWFFSFGSDRAHTTANLLLSGRDHLGFHQWALQAGRDFKNDLPLGQLSYTLYHHLNLSYERYYEYQIGDAGVPGPFVDEAITEERHDNVSAIGFYEQDLGSANLTWFAGVNINDEEYLNLINQRLFRDWHVRTLGGGMHFTSASRPWRALGPTHGRSIKATLERDRVRVLGAADGMLQKLKFSGKVWSLDWTEYLHIFKAQRLELRLFAAEAESGADPFDLGGSSLRSMFTDNLIHHRDYRLRAYPDRTPELRGRKPRIMSADYEFPMLRVHQGIAGWPVGMRDLSATVFYESGQADKRLERFDSAGVELNLGLDLGYSLLPLTLTGGVALPFQDTLVNRQKDANFYVNVGLGL